MFQFAGYAPLPLAKHGLWPSVKEVTPFGNPRIKSCLPLPRGLSQAATSFIAFLMSRHPPCALKFFSILLEIHSIYSLNCNIFVLLPFFIWDIELNCQCPIQDVLPRLLSWAERIFFRFAQLNITILVGYPSTETQSLSDLIVYFCHGNACLPAGLRLSFT